MVSKQFEQHEYTKLKTKLNMLRMDLIFLKQCKKMKVFPNYINKNVKIYIKNENTLKVLMETKKIWLRLEIKSKYRHINGIEKDVYNLHMLLTKNLKSNIDFEEWQVFDRKVHSMIERKMSIKSSKLLAKLKRLNFNEERREERLMFPPEIVENFVLNLSSQTFNKNELDLLNRGPNYAIPGMAIRKEATIIDIETGIKYFKKEDKDYIRSSAIKILKESRNMGKGSLIANKTKELIESIKMKDCIISKADKSNQVVIMDKLDYNERMTGTIQEMSCKAVKKDPVKMLARKTSELINKYKTELGATKWKLLVSNPRCPQLYGLPKTHKAGNKMRPVVSNINAPTEKMAKWLVKEFNNFRKPFSFSVKNTLDFVDRVKNVVVPDGFILVSFDVKALYPSVPLGSALNSLNEWIEDQNIDNVEKKMLKEFARFCMKNSYFEFDNKFYQQIDGTAIGNALAGFVSSDIFMGQFEKRIMNEDWFPEVWIRYVDDIFAVIPDNSAEDIIRKLNNIELNKIEFTYETESERKLPFLDVCVKHNIGGTLSFEIYRKPTSINRLITSDSHHCYQQKISAFNSMVFRLLNIPLDEGAFSIELKYIKKTAEINGYSPKLVDSIMEKQIKKRKLYEITTLGCIKDKSVRRIKMTYNPPLCGRFKNIFQNYDCAPIYSSQFKIKNVFCNNKRKDDSMLKSGIYKIKCSTCGFIYIGQSRRAIINRWKEHNEHIRKNEPQKSSVAYHFLENIEHKLEIANFKLIKSVKNTNELDAWESFFMAKNGPFLMNTQPPPILSSLFSI